MSILKTYSNGGDKRVRQYRKLEKATKKSEDLDAKRETGDVKTIPYMIQKSILEGKKKRLKGKLEKSGGVPDPENTDLNVMVASKGGEKKYYTDPKEFAKAQQAYSDSLNLYQQSQQVLDLADHFDYYSYADPIPFDKVKEIIEKNPSEAFFGRDSGRIMSGGAEYHENKKTGGRSGRVNRQEFLLEFIERTKKDKIRPIGFAPEFNEEYDPNQLYDYAVIYKKPEVKPVFNKRELFNKFPKERLKSDVPDMNLKPTEDVKLKIGGNSPYKMTANTTQKEKDWGTAYVPGRGHVKLTKDQWDELDLLGKLPGEKNKGIIDTYVQK